MEKEPKETSATKQLRERTFLKSKQKILEGESSTRLVTLRNNNSFFETRGTIVLIKHEGNLWYNACPTCNKKVTEENGQWKCEKCNTLLPNCEKR